MSVPPSTPRGSRSGTATRRESAGRQPAKGQAGSGARGGIQSLERAAAILDAVARSPEGIILADLSVRVGLHNSTAFHLVKTLVNLGFITQVAETKRYRIGSRLFMLAAGALDESALLSLATPVLERLSAQTGETTHLAIRSQQEIVVIARTAASGLLQLAGRTGSVRPAHATALGKMLLAAMAPDDLDQLVKVLPLDQFTPKTITDRRALVREVDDVRRQGIAYDDGEYDVDVRCVAVPVRDFAGRCAGAIGLSGPVWRLSLQSVQDKSRQLRTAAAELSAQLGFDGGHVDD
jgi:IclR family acetate operon transcriptional repressor